MSQLVESPFPIYTDSDGTPLENGYIFIGEPGLSPITNPKQAYWDSTLTNPANDIRTKGGYPMQINNPGRLYVDGNYSIVVQDKRGATLYTKLSAIDFSGGETVGTMSAVDSLSELRAFVPAEPFVQVSLAGLDSAGDQKPGPIYYWDADSVETDNGSSIIKPTSVSGSGRWKWRNIAPPIVTTNVTATQTVSLGFSTNVFVVTGGTPVELTIPDGDYDSQDVHVVNAGTSTVKIIGTDIPTDTFVDTNTKITWLDAGWTGLIIGVDEIKVEDASVSGDLDVTGKIDAATVNTGQGDNELYAMDQDVTTASDVEFEDVKIDGSTYLTFTDADEESDVFTTLSPYVPNNLDRRSITGGGRLGPGIVTGEPYPLDVEVSFTNIFRQDSLTILIQFYDTSNQEMSFRRILSGAAIPVTSAEYGFVTGHLF